MNPPRWAAISAGDVQSLAAGWLTTPALGAVATAFRGPTLRDIPADLPGFATWSDQALCNRHGTERHDAAPGKFGSEEVRTLIEASGPLGLLATRAPELAEYDLTVVLGGTVLGNRLRVALAAELHRAGIGLGQLVGLSADRPLGDIETASDPAAQRDGTEWRHLQRVMNQVFGDDQHPPPTGPTRATGRSGIDVPWIRGDNGIPLRLMVAPSTSEARRADTADSVAFLTNRMAPSDRMRILLITSAIYAPYQFLVSAPILLAGSTRHVELTGTPTSTGGDRHILANRVAQEIHSAINAALRLWPDVHSN